MTIVLVSLILLVTLYLLVSERLPVDLTSIGVMVVLVVTGILTPEESLSGFANPAPITIALLFIVTQGLVRTGALDFVSVRVMRASRGNPKLLLALCLVIVGGLSSFLNNTPVVVIFLSIVMAACCEYGFSPSKFLMPISFVSILAGTSTLIGTSTNILVSDLARAEGMEPIAMFELTILAAPVAMVGAVFIYFLSDRLLRAHKEPVCKLTDDETQRYLSELYLPAESPWVGREARAAVRDDYPDADLYEVIRGDRVLDPLQESVELLERDILLIKASASDLVHLLDHRRAVLTEGEAKPYDERSLIVELVVAPGSELVGRRLRLILAELDSHIHLLGVKRRQIHFSFQKTDNLRLSIGDILLVQAPHDHIDQIRAAGRFVVVEGVLQTVKNRKRAPLALAIFLGMMAAASLGLTSILVAAMTAAFLMLVTRCLSAREAYRALDARVLLLIIGTLALGAALAKTGAADLYARAFLAPFSGASPWLVLSGFILLTSVLSLFLSNNSTAVLLVPIGISTAAAIGVDARPFIIGICFGASACYASPIGYQTNLLVYGPGGYRFADYLRLGLPLNVFVWLAASIFIPWIWSF